MGGIKAEFTAVLSESQWDRSDESRKGLGEEIPLQGYYLSVQ